MKNLNIEEIAKIEKCECEEVCEACREKHSHSFPENNPVNAHITGDLIATIVLRDEQKSDSIKDIEQIKELLNRIEKRERANQK
jgi:hypothetical protein